MMGPTCGMRLADLAADVIKVEPPSGDSTRTLLGAGACFYSLFNPNTRSLSVKGKATGEAAFDRTRKRVST